MYANFDTVRLALNAALSGDIGESVRAAEIPADLIVNVDDVANIFGEEDCSTGDVGDRFHSCAGFSQHSTGGKAGTGRVLVGIERDEVDRGASPLNGRIGP